MKELKYAGLFWFALGLAFAGTMVIVPIIVDLGTRIINALQNLL